MKTLFLLFLIHNQLSILSSLLIFNLKIEKVIRLIKEATYYFFSYSEKHQTKNKNQLMIISLLNILKIKWVSKYKSLSKKRCWIDTWNVK